MKRVILCTLSSYKPYKYTKPEQVIYEVVQQELSKYNISATRRCVSELVKCIRKYKQDKGLIFHHNDTDTFNNAADNIVLIKADAHGYIHAPTIQLIFREKFGLVTPGYASGRLAHDKDVDVMKKVGEVLEFNECTISQITDALFSQSSDNSKNIVQAIMSEDVQHLTALVSAYLCMLNIRVVTYDQVHSVVRDYLRLWGESDGYTDVDYIDDDTALAVSLLLKDYRQSCKSKLKQKSVDAILSFIQDNNASKANICKHRYGDDCFIFEDVAQ